jgi:hypothetical protein
MSCASRTISGERRNCRTTSLDRAAESVEESTCRMRACSRTQPHTHRACPLRKVLGTRLPSREEQSFLLTRATYVLRDGSEREGFRAASYANSSWWESIRPALTRLAERNSMDLELYAWASSRLRAALERHWKGYKVPMPALPPLPCTRQPGSYCWDSGGPPVDVADAA